MDDITDPSNFTESLAGTWIARDQENHLEQGAGASNPIANVPPAPPSPTLVNSPEPTSLPTVLSLFPNPSEGYSYLNYVIHVKGKTTIRVMDLQGKTVLPLVEEQQVPGNYLLEIDGRDLSTGTYLLEVRHGEQSATKLLVRK